MFTDPFSNLPPGWPRLIFTVLLLVAVVVSGWILRDVRGAMNWMARLGPGWWPGRATAIRLANQPGWIWFYRIDCAVVLVGALWMLASHWLLQH
jgi:hypothetical protein